MDPENIMAHFKTKIPDFKAMDSDTPGIFSTFKTICKIFIAWFIFLFKLLIEAFKLQYEWWSNDFRELIRVFTTLFAWERFARSQLPTNPGAAADAVYWQTLCVGTYKNGSPEETEMLFKTWSDLLQPLRKFMQNHPKITEKYPLVAVAKYGRATWQSYAEFWPYIGCS
jgi:hypothetical protein